MGLKESGLRGSLRNVSVGIVAIPDSEIYLQDEFGDGQLQNRDCTGTTAHNGVEGVYRPEWSQVNSEDFPSVVDGSIVVDQDEYATADINLNFDETITWEITNLTVDPNNQGMGTTSAISLFAGTDTMITGDNFDAGALHEGYVVVLRGDGDECILRRVDDEGETNVMVDFTNSEWSDDDLTITRDPNGEFEVLLNGVSQGSDINTDFADDGFIGVGSRDDVDSLMEFDEIKVR